MATRVICVRKVKKVVKGKQVKKLQSGKCPKGATKKTVRVKKRKR